jgi:uncharacterized protein (DUF1697 family)
MLRGINVGSHRRIAMADLRVALAAAGYPGATTYLQSGNVLLRSDASPEQVAGTVEQAIRSHFSLEVPVLVRTREQLAALLAHDPLAHVATDPRRYQVTFLMAPLEPATEQALRDFLTPVEQIAFTDREVFAWHPDGIHQSRLATALASPRLGQVATARNWATLTQLLKLTRASC